MRFSSVNRVNNETVLKYVYINGIYTLGHFWLHIHYFPFSFYLAIKQRFLPSCTHEDKHITLEKFVNNELLTLNYIWCTPLTREYLCVYVHIWHESVHRYPYIELNEYSWAFAIEFTLILVQIGKCTEIVCWILCVWHYIIRSIIWWQRFKTYQFYYTRTHVNLLKSTNEQAHAIYPIQQQQWHAKCLASYGFFLGGLNSFWYFNQVLF